MVDYVNSNVSDKQDRKSRGNRSRNNAKSNVDQIRTALSRKPEDFENVVVEPVNPCVAPDEAEFSIVQAKRKEEIAGSRRLLQEIDAELQTLQQRKTTILEAMKPSGSVLKKLRESKVAVYSELESNQIQQDKINESLALEKEELKRVKKNLTYISEGHINEAVEVLERQMSQSGLSLRDEKAIISKIRAVKAKGAELKAYRDQEIALRQRPDHLTPLKEVRFKLVEELRDLKSREKALNFEFEGFRTELSKLTARMQELKEKKASVLESTKKLKEEYEKQHSDYAKQMGEFQKYQRWLRYKRYLQNKKMKEEKADTQRQRAAEREAELAKMDPFQEQKELCTSLEGYLRRFISVNEEQMPESSQKINKRENCKSTVDDEDDDWGLAEFSTKRDEGYRKKRGLRKGLVSLQLVHSPDVFADMNKLGTKVPMTISEVPHVLAEVKKLRAYYETAPHPKKLQEIEENVKRAEEDLRHRRARSRVTLPLFEKERARILTEEKRHSDLENQMRSAARVLAIEIMESERASRIKEHQIASLNSQVNRLFNCRLSTALAEQERQFRLQELYAAHSCSELIRSLNRKLAAQLFHHERLYRLTMQRFSIVVDELINKFRSEQLMEYVDAGCRSLEGSSSQEGVSTVSGDMPEKVQSKRTVQLLLTRFIEQHIQNVKLEKALSEEGEGASLEEFDNSYFEVEGSPERVCV